MSEKISDERLKELIGKSANTITMFEAWEVCRELSAARAALAKLPKWVSVADDSPDGAGYILVYAKTKGRDVASFENNKWHDREGGISAGPRRIGSPFPHPRSPHDPLPSRCEVQTNFFSEELRGQT